VVLGLAFAGVVALPVLAQDPGALRRQADQARSRERSLGSEVERLGRLAAATERQLAVLERRRGEVQADLAGDEARLASVQADLREQRARLVRLRTRLTEVRRTLANRLVVAYKTPQEDLTTVVVTSRSLADLLERTRYLKSLEHQDREILRVVRSARGDAAHQTRRLTGAELRQRRLVLGLRARRNALAAMSQAVAARRAALVRARAARAEALQATRANRQHLESRLAAVERELARAASFGASGGPWAIPASVVMCESGGQNLPPNSAGASGYYQILPETWRLHGGSGPAAYQASKAEQDKVAANIWAGGRGASQWVCAGIVGIG
jgi:septal ring factor EnvC (AmiA/AmiB activator)